MIVRKLLSLLWLASFSLYAQSGLDIYFVDVEGGAATLIVTPQRESILIDTGWQREDRRDARRINEVATRLAGLPQIDYLVTTHFHRDHYGGVLQLSEMIPILNFLDHGPMTGLREDPMFTARYAEYQKAHRGQRRKIEPGDEIPLTQGEIPLRAVCLASDG
ncbi:MBL fold metallo-hydrolase, partial [Acidobacteria bacterium AH-259-A15]|nr:MBL fold metallo-hydrolase [Acidobacteria bacterium AH-259-A15]